MLNRVVCISVLLGHFCVAMAYADTKDIHLSKMDKALPVAEDFYDVHTELKSFFPFGSYLDIYSHDIWKIVDVPKHEMREIGVEIMACQGMNVIWDGNFIRLVKDRAPSGDQPIELSEEGLHYFEQTLPDLEMKIFPGLTHLGTRYSSESFEGLGRKHPMFNQIELDVLQKRLAKPLAFAQHMAQTYPRTVMGFITDDEPHETASAIAVAKLVEQATKRTVTFCKPTFSGFKEYINHVQPMTGDWYVNGDIYQRNWDIQSRLRWLAKEHPDQIFYFLPGAISWAAFERTKPWLAYNAVSPTDIRMQFWQSLAFGSKGYFYFMTDGSIAWTRGRDGLLNPLLRPNGMQWDQIGKLGSLIQAIGPSMLDAWPDMKRSLKIDCDQMVHPAFSGPQMNAGILATKDRTRQFVVVFSNLLKENTTGRIDFSALLRDGLQLYDMHKLERIDLGDDQTLRLILKAAGGQVYLICTPQTFSKVCDEVRMHQVRLPRVRASVAREHAGQCSDVHMKQVNELWEQALIAQDKQDWIAARSLYESVLMEVNKAKSQVTYITRTQTVHDRLGDVLSEMDDLFVSYSDFNSDKSHFLGLGKRQELSAYINDTSLPAHEQIIAWKNGVAAYFNAIAAMRKGEYQNGKLARQLDLILQSTIKAHQQLQDLIQAQLDKHRKPGIVALITPDRVQMEYHLTCSWLYETFDCRWFAPGEDGKLRDLQSRLLNLSTYDVIWIHQITDCSDQPGVQLMSQVQSPSFVSQLRHQLNTGKGMLLTGVAGLLANELGLEHVKPNITQANHYDMSRAWNLGSVPMAGYQQHPLFDQLDKNGFYTNTNFPGQNLVTINTWDGIKPTGSVIACEYDEHFGPIPEYALAVEYELGLGKVMAIGGRSFDMTPGSPQGLDPAALDPTLPSKPVTRYDLRSAVRKMTTNALSYLAGNGRFEPGSTKLRKQESNIVPLPRENWQFNTDPKDIGLAEKWFAVDHVSDGWNHISIGAPWESQGYPGYDGVAWYRRQVKLAGKAGKRCLLTFGAVDEEARVYLDGQLIYTHEMGPNGWKIPFTIDITGKLSLQPKEHILTVRVHDSLMAGGIWKPIYLEFKPSNESANR